ncbi:hypothetical protein ACQ3I4_09115 [Zafaria sp. Z1313]|uniref:hypothetical protein n=1 Tax=Zafaria sp. Z1313 TaxID=3423202 RepID=UPI003D3024B2
MNLKRGLVAAGLGLMLTGCAAATPPVVTVTVTAPPSEISSASESPEAAQPSPSSSLNDRGQLPKRVGQSGGISSEGGKQLLDFTVTGFEFVECTNSYAGDLNGRALAVMVEVATAAEFEGPLVVNGAEGMISFDAYYWRGYGPDGTRMSGLDSEAIQNCMDSDKDLLPSYIGKGEKAKGLVLLDVTSDTGEVAFVPYDTGGWVWEYPGNGASA